MNVQTLAEIIENLRAQGKAFNEAADTLQDNRGNQQNGNGRANGFLRLPPHGNAGRHMSAETRKKMSASQKARHASKHIPAIVSVDDMVA
jgi:hypothetical protein